VPFHGVKIKNEIDLTTIRRMWRREGRFGEENRGKGRGGEEMGGGRVRTREEGRW